MLEQTGTHFHALETLGLRKAGKSDEDVLLALAEYLADAPRWPHRVSYIVTDTNSAHW
jgi:hypothetical protein